MDCIWGDAFRGIVNTQRSHVSDKISNNKVSVVQEAISTYLVGDNWLVSEC